MMTETEFPCGAYDSRTAKNENKQMPDKDINNKDKIQMEQSGVSGLESVISPPSGYAAANPQKLHPSIKKDKIQMEHPGENSSDPALSSQSGYADATLQKIHPSIKNH